jgi:hypothetical protein
MKVKDDSERPFNRCSQCNVNSVKRAKLFDSSFDGHEFNRTFWDITTTCVAP